MKLQLLFLLFVFNFNQVFCKDEIEFVVSDTFTKKYGKQFLIYYCYCFRGIKSSKKFNYNTKYSKTVNIYDFNSITSDNDLEFSLYIYDLKNNFIVNKTFDKGTFPYFLYKHIILLDIKNNNGFIEEMSVDVNISYV